MKRWILVLLLALGLPAVSWGADLASDDFNRADGGLGANWTTVSGKDAPAIVSNQVQPSVVAGQSSQAVYTGITWPENQYVYATAVAVAINSNRIEGLILRSQTASDTKYLAYYVGALGAGSQLTVARYNAGAATILYGPTVKTLTAGQVVKFSVVGSGANAVLHVYYDGVDQTGAITDTSPLAGGSPGLYAYTSAAPTTGVQLDTWGAGNSGSVGSASADTWYVMPAATCTNNGDGLASNCAASAGASGAFNSFANIIWTATDGVDDGDTLCVSGKHRETMTPAGSGSINSPITIQGDCAGVTAGTISGANVESSWTGPDGNGNYTAGTSYTLPYAVAVDGTAAKHGDAAASLTDGEWYLSGTDVLYHGDPTGHTIEIGARGWAIDGRASATSHMTITGMAFENTRGETRNGAIVFTNCAHIHVTYSTFYNHPKGVDYRGTCTYSSGDYNTLTLVSDGLDSNIDTGQPTFITWTHNDVSSTYNIGTWSTTSSLSNWLAGLEATHGSIDQECIASTSPGGSHFFLNNTVRYCYQGIFVLTESSAASNIEIISNETYHTARHGVVFGNFGQLNTNIKIKGNLINGCGSASPSTSHGVNITGGADGTTIYVNNNTVVNCSNGYSLSGTGNAYLSGLFTNNINGNIIKFGTAYSAYHLDTSALLNPETMIVNNNIYVGTVGGWRKSGGAYRSTFANWQSDVSAWSQETNSSSPTEAAWSTAGFVSSDGDDFRLVSSSAGRRAGISVGSCADVRGRACYPDSPDIGAYQATSGDPSTTRSAASARTAAGARSPVP